MDSNRIDELLKKYWDCETSIEEEQQLKAFFRGQEIPEQLKETAALFQYFEHEKKKTIADQSFETKVLTSVGGPKQGKVTRLFYNSMRIAAGIAVLLVAIWFVREEIRSTNPPAVIVSAEDTYDDPKLAFEETKKALMMISKSFGSAEDKAKKLNMFNDAKEQVQKESSKSQL